MAMENWFWKSIALNGWTEEIRTLKLYRKLLAGNEYDG